MITLTLIHRVCLNTGMGNSTNTKQQNTFVTGSQLKKSSSASATDLIAKILISTLATVFAWPLFEGVLGLFSGNQAAGLAIFTVILSFPLFLIVSGIISALLYSFPRTRDKLILYCLLPTPLMSIIFRVFFS